MTNDEFVLYWLTIYVAIAQGRLLYMMYHGRDNEVPGLFKWLPTFTAWCLFIIKWVV